MYQSQELLPNTHHINCRDILSVLKEMSSVIGLDLILGN